MPQIVLLARPAIKLCCRLAAFGAQRTSLRQTDRATSLPLHGVPRVLYPVHNNFQPFGFLWASILSK